MDMKRKKLYEKQKSVELREEDGSPHPKVCEHNEHKDTAGVCSREDSGANKSLEQLDVVQHVDFKNLQKECASNSQRQHTSSPLEPQKTQEACYLTDDDDKTRAEGDMNAGCTVHDAIDQRYGGIDAASYQSVAQKTHTKCSSQKRVATLPPSNKRPAKLIKVEFNVTIQGKNSEQGTRNYGEMVSPGVTW